MNNAYDKLVADIKQVQQLSIVDNILEVICRTTGLGFAAIARVTKDHWIACRVRDEINFGLEDGGELKIETTICSEVRDQHRTIVIDHVDEDVDFRNHRTPKMYGFQSYISHPIYLKTGEFFGTLCAIDPRPAKLKDTSTVAMFQLFADLLSFHLISTDLIAQSGKALADMTQKVTTSDDEVRQYRYISSHGLREPIRKIAFFSDMMMKESERGNYDQARELALKVHNSARNISAMMTDLSNLTSLSDTDSIENRFAPVDLNIIVQAVLTEQAEALSGKHAVVNVGELPTVSGLSIQLEQMFFHLITNTLNFSKDAEQLVINITGEQVHYKPIPAEALASQGYYHKIMITDNGIGIRNSDLEGIFDIFSQLKEATTPTGSGIGLPSCRRIINNHHGFIKVSSAHGDGTTFSVFFPVMNTNQ